MPFLFEKYSPKIIFPLIINNLQYFLKIVLFGRNTTAR